MIAQSHQVKERSKSIHNMDIFPGEILLIKTPLSLLSNEPRNLETITMHSSHKSLLHSDNCLTLIQTKATNT